MQKQDEKTWDGIWKRAKHQSPQLAALHRDVCTLQKKHHDTLKREPETRIMVLRLRQNIAERISYHYADTA